LYDNNEQPKISGVKRVSKQSKRVYLGVKDLKSVRNSYGKAIVSTPRGIMTGDDAKQAKVGGELLFQIW
jgi:small subunit ribosomal protein S8